MLRALFSRLEVTSVVFWHEPGWIELLRMHHFRPGISSVAHPMHGKGWISFGSAEHNSTDSNRYVCARQIEQSQVGAMLGHICRMLNARFERRRGSIEMFGVEGADGTKAVDINGHRVCTGAIAMLDDVNIGVAMMREYSVRSTPRERPFGWLELLDLPVRTSEADFARSSSSGLVIHNQLIRMIDGSFSSLFVVTLFVDSGELGLACDNLIVGDT